MEILWLAIIFYSVGLGLILHFRPTLMFHENGTWKEFGYQRSSDSRHTLFPFWLFAIVWAFASYVLAAAIVWSFSSTPVIITGLSGVAAASSFSQGDMYESSQGETDAEEEGEEEEEEVVPVKRPRGRPRKTEKTEVKQPRAGYYVVDPETSETGLRRYIYYGDKPPA
jgi:hypothetical protein